MSTEPKYTYCVVITDTLVLMKTTGKTHADSPSAHKGRLAVIRNAYSYDFGGAERLAAHIAQEAQTNGWTSYVVTHQEQLLRYAASLGLVTNTGWWWSRQNWGGKRALLFPIYIVWQLCLLGWYLQLFLQLKIDAVHIMSRDDFIAATLAAKILGKHVIWTDTADLKYIYKNMTVWYKNPVGRLVRFVGRWARAIILVSYSEKALIEKELSQTLPANYSVIHIAGRDEKVKPRARSAADKKAVIFCATSRMVTAKGIGELIEAFRRLSPEYPNVRLWLLGDGPERSRFEAMADNPHIVFVGHTNKPLEYLAASDVFVHPSYHEGFSLAIAEAAMLGKPMVVTDIGGNPELVNQGNGILIPIKNADALYQAMCSLVNNPALRQKLGQAARQDYVTKFDFATIMKKEIVPLYE